MAAETVAFTVPEASKGLVARASCFRISPCACKHVGKDG